ncbi:MAG: PepSY-like domain-containing protein [Alistipes sp.]|nr:PepSY-like domain-containing protein [Alistipes sp.]MDE6857589.1 PepSY-like domain-containing protein [Alistipes sp.]
MKKIIITAIALLAAGIAGAFAAPDAPIDAEKLPQSIREFVAKHFPGDKIAFAKVDRGIFDTEYNVLLSSGTKMEFAGNGEWTEIKSKYSSVPESIVPQQIADAVASRYPTAKIVQIDRGRHDYEVELSNGIDITFDMQFNITDIDD